MLQHMFFINMRD